MECSISVWKQLQDWLFCVGHTDNYNNFDIIMQIYYIHEKAITSVELEGNIVNDLCGILNVVLCAQGLHCHAFLHPLILAIVHAKVK